MLSDYGISIVKLERSENLRSKDAEYIKHEQWRVTLENEDLDTDEIGILIPESVIEPDEADIVKAIIDPTHILIEYPSYTNWKRFLWNGGRLSDGGKVLKFRASEKDMQEIFDRCRNTVWRLQNLFGMDQWKRFVELMTKGEEGYQ